MRKLFSIIVLIATLLFISTSAQASPKVILDGKQLTFDVSPYIENGRTLVPLRTIFEALGAQIHWDEASNTVTVIKGDTEIILVVGGRAFKNQIPVNLDVPATILNGRTMVPLRFISEALGCIVLWDNTTETIKIDNINKEMSSYGVSESILYENEIHGFRLKYPSNWILMEKAPQGIIAFLMDKTLDHDNMVAVGAYNADDDSLTDKMKEEFINSIKDDVEDFQLLDSSSFLLGRKKAIKIVYIGKGVNNIKQKFVTIATLSNSKYYFIMGSETLSNDNTSRFFKDFDKMIKTFEFPENIPANLGITYDIFDNPLYKFTIKYPHDWIIKYGTKPDIAFMETDSLSKRSVLVNITSTTESEMTLDDMRNVLISELNKSYKDFNLIETSTAMLDCIPAARISFLGRIGDNMNKIVVTSTYNNNRFYLIYGNIVTNDTSEILDTYIDMIGSFKFIE